MNDGFLDFDPGSVLELVEPVLQAGDSLEAFLKDFPTVSRAQAVHFVELAGKAILAPLSARPAR